MPSPRLFLVTPAVISENLLLSCATAAANAGDCACIVLTAKTSLGTISDLQALNLAVLVNDTELGGADGVQLDASLENVSAFRKSLGKSAMIGAFCAASRHVAMEAAEQGADYVAFSQNQQVKGEPLLSWWVDLFEIPVVAFDPVGLADLDILLPQNPDFIRPSDAMLENPTIASELISELTARLSQ